MSLRSCGWYFRTYISVYPGLLYFETTYIIVVISAHKVESKHCSPPPRRALRRAGADWIRDAADPQKRPRVQAAVSDQLGVTAAENLNNSLQTTTSAHN